MGDAGSVGGGKTGGRVSECEGGIGGVWGGHGGCEGNDTGNKFGGGRRGGGTDGGVVMEKVVRVGAETLVVLQVA